MVTTIKRRTLRWLFDRLFAWRVAEFTGSQLIALDYPVDARPRFSPSTTPHPELGAWFARQRGWCQATLVLVAQALPCLEAIRAEASARGEPYWNNQWFSALDAMALYTLVSHRRPPRIVEVGSGNSTKFAARAVRDG